MSKKTRATQGEEMRKEKNPQAKGDGQAADAAGSEEAAKAEETAKANEGQKGQGEKAGDQGRAEQAKAGEGGAEEEAADAKYLRLMADFQNFKRRTEKEKSDIYAFANEKIISELLNVIDNFERALAHGTEGDSFTEGMNMIFKQLQGVLEKAGVTEIEALGTDFDPNFHNAVMMEDSTEYESGKVTAVLQKGYILNNRVIRPSMVKVAN